MIELISSESRASSADQLMALTKRPMTFPLV